MTKKKNDRRRRDQRISQLVTDVFNAKGERAQMQEAIAENTTLTLKLGQDLTELQGTVGVLQATVGEIKSSVEGMKETVEAVRDGFTSLRVILKVGKWLAGIAAVFVSIKTGISTFLQK